LHAMMGNRVVEWVPQKYQDLAGKLSQRPKLSIFNKY
jgi:hypothetical protein